MAKAHTLVDNFNDNSADLSKWIVAENPQPARGRIREVNGRIEIRPQAGATGYSGYKSVTTYDLTASAIFVEVVQALSGSVGTDLQLNAQMNGLNEISIGIKDGYLYAASEVAGVVTFHERRPYDEQTHRWLQIVSRAGARTSRRLRTVARGPR